MKNNLLKKFLSFSIGGYIALGIGFFTTPVITRLISPKEYGMASMVTLVSNLLLLICLLGLDQGFVRYFYEEKNKKKLLNNCIKYPFFIYAIIVIIIFIFWEKISLFIFGEKNIILIEIIIINTFLLIINRFFSLIIRMNQKAKLFSIIQVLNQGLIFIFIFMLYKKYGDSAKTVIYASTITSFIIMLISIISEKDILAKDESEEKVSKKELLYYSLPLALTMSLNWIFSSADRIIIKYFTNLTEVGIYTAGFKIIALLNIIQTGFTTFWTPVAYERYIRNNSEKTFYENIFELISFVMLFLGILILIGKDFLIYILGPKYKESSYIIPMLVLMPIMYTISETTVIGINFKKKTKYHLYISIIVSMINILGNIFLVPKYGAKGAAISTGISYVLFFYLRTYFSLKLLKFNFNIKKLSFFLILLVSYAMILTLKKFTILIMIWGLIIEIMILFFYGLSLKKAYLTLKKGEKY